MEHGHIATDAVTMACDGAQIRKLSGAHGGFEMIQLRNVLPGWEVRISCERDVVSSLWRINREKARWIILEILLRAAHIKFWMLARPWMIERSVIADKIKEQSHSQPAEFFTYTIERSPGADALVRNILRDRVGGADDVARFPSGERSIIRCKIGGVFESNTP